MLQEAQPRRARRFDFDIEQRGSSVGREVVAGVTTFVTMAYVLFVNPSILGAAGIPREAVAVATAVASCVATLAMGLYANYPFALAPGMGLNGALAFGIVAGMGVPWQTAMGVVFVEGAIVTILVLTNVREAVMDAIPFEMKQAIGAGIGLFIAFIGLMQSGIVVKSESTLVTFGSFRDPGVLLTFGGLFATAALLALRVRGAILLGVLLTALAGIPMRITRLPDRVFALPHPGSLATFFQLDVAGALQVGLLSTVFAFLITDFFDTMGTVVAVAGEGGLLSGGRLPRIRRVLLVDSLAAVLGGLVGSSSVTTYVESAAGVAEGGRTGLASVVTAGLFALAIFIAPVLVVVPAQATAPALIVVGFLMLGTVVREIRFDRYDEAFPAFVTLLTVPLTYSIARGIGYGFLTYCVVKILTGRARQVHPAMWVAAVLFVVSFVWA